MADLRAGPRLIKIDDITKAPLVHDLNEPFMLINFHKKTIRLK